MDYLAAKYLHFLGLAVWIGMIPYEAYATKRIVRTRDQRLRYRYLRFANKLRYYQEYPCIILVVCTGVWLATIHGFDTLLRQEWFIWKLSLLGCLVGAEIYLTYEAIVLERKCKAAADRGEEANVQDDSPFGMIIGTLAILWFNSIFMVVVFKQVPLPGIALILTAVVPPFVLEVAYYRRWRAGHFLTPDAAERPR